MNFYKLNQKKLLVKNKLVLGLDLAKEKHVASFMLPDGTLIGKPTSLGQDRISYERLWKDATALRDQNQLSGIVLAMEATGSFWEPLAHYFNRVQPSADLVFVSGRVMKRSRELMDLSRSKNDPKDSYMIAQLTLEGKFMMVRIPKGVWAELRGLGNLRADLLKAQVAWGNRIRAVQDKCWPERESVLKNCLNKTSLHLFEHSPFPGDVLRLGQLGLLPLVLEGSNRRLGRKIAQRLVDAAANSVGITEGLEAARAELAEATVQVRTIQEQLARVESRLLQLVKTTGYAEAISSIPGVSELGAALLLGELGDPSEFKSAKEWIKLAGLNLIENQSGKGKREGKRISRVGRPLLRTLLYQMAVTTLRHNPILHATYLNLRIAGKATVKALVANMCRLLRIVFALCKSKASFETREGALREVEQLKMRLAESRQPKRAKAA